MVAFIKFGGGAILLVRVQRHAGGEGRGCARDADIDQNAPNEMRLDFDVFKII